MALVRPSTLQPVETQKPTGYGIDRSRRNILAPFARRAQQQLAAGTKRLLEMMNGKEMKRRIHIHGLLIALGIAAVSVSCQKGDPYYADFKNETQTYDGTTLEYIEVQHGTFDSLVLVLDRLPELRQLLGADTSTLTLFAVTNRSFELAVNAMNNARALSSRPPLYLEDIEKEELDSLVSRYLFTKTYDTEFLSPFREG